MHALTLSVTFVSAATLFCLASGRALSEAGKVEVEGCGRSGVDTLFPVYPDGMPGISPRIIEGMDVDIQDFPWQVQIQWRNCTTQRWRHLCGGSILNEDWIVTAAHCFFLPNECNPLNESDFRVVAGIDTLDDEKQPGRSVREIARIRNHPHGHDIALVRLSTPLPLSAKGYMNGICLPEPGDDFSETNALAQVSGWGTRVAGISESWKKLQAVEVPLIGRSKCIAMIRSAGYKINRLADHQLCAGYVSGVKDSCEGDSGGPLILRMESGAVLVGVVSSGYGCARPRLPGLYTDVATHVPWIRKTVLASDD